MTLPWLDIHIHILKIQLDTDFTSYTKNQNRVYVDLNVKWNIIKLLDENIVKNLHELGVANEF